MGYAQLISEGRSSVCLHVQVETRRNTPLTHIYIYDPGASHKQHGFIYSNSQQYIVWLKIIHFYFMPKTLDIKI